MVQDFRELNKYTIKDVTPLPDIKQAIKGLGNKVLFTKFDVREGYNNIQIAPEDQWKTGFKTHRGLFEFNVMPFGLCNAPGTFSRGLRNALPTDLDITWMTALSPRQKGNWNSTKKWYTNYSTYLKNIPIF
jgi:hypothetical protein